MAKTPTLPFISFLLNYLFIYLNFLEAENQIQQASQNLPPNSPCAVMGVDNKPPAPTVLPDTPRVDISAAVDEEGGRFNFFYDFGNTFQALRNLWRQAPQASSRRSLISVTGYTILRWCITQRGRACHGGKSATVLTVFRDTSCFASYVSQ